MLKKLFGKRLDSMGSLVLAELDSLIESCCINNLLVVDDGYESMVQLADIADSQDIIQMQENRISLHFVVEQDLDSILNLLKRPLHAKCFHHVWVLSSYISTPICVAGVC